MKNIELVLAALLISLSVSAQTGSVESMEE